MAGPCCPGTGELVSKIGASSKSKHFTLTTQKDQQNMEISYFFGPVLAIWVSGASLLRK